MSKIKLEDWGEDCCICGGKECVTIVNDEIFDVTAPHGIRVNVENLRATKCSFCGDGFYDDEASKRINIKCKKARKEAETRDKKE